MAQSLNSKVDLTIKATSFAGLSTNGNVMVGNKAFEFYMKEMLKIVFKFHGIQLIE